MASKSLLGKDKCDCSKCTYCANAFGNISIKCAECVDFHLCLKCFSMSAEIGSHKKDHNYSIKSLSLCFPLFDTEKLWSYKEELMLVQLIEQYGFGDWEEIAKHLSNRTAEECMQHYHSYYIYGNLGKYTFCPEKLFTSAAKQPSKQQQSHNQSNNILITSSLEKAHHHPHHDDDSTVLLPPIEMSVEEQRALGYMPLRDDFEREYRNGIEVELLSNLTVANSQLQYLNLLYKDSNSAETVDDQTSLSALSKDDDDAVELEVKLAFVEMYRECLVERQRLKKIAREHGLINNAAALINNRNKMLNGTCSTIQLGGLNGIKVDSRGRKIDRRRKQHRIRNHSDKQINELNEKLKKFAQFMSVSNYETLLENLRKQRHLSQRIQELQRYRTDYGLTKFDEIEHLNRERDAMRSPRGSIIRRRRLSSSNGDVGGDFMRKQLRSSPSKYLTPPLKRFTKRGLWKASPPSSPTFKSASTLPRIYTSKVAKKSTTPRTLLVSNHSNAAPASPAATVPKSTKVKTEPHHHESNGVAEAASRNTSRSRNSSTNNSLAAAEYDEEDEDDDEEEEEEEDEEEEEQESQEYSMSESSSGELESEEESDSYDESESEEEEEEEEDASDESENGSGRRRLKRRSCNVKKSTVAAATANSKKRKKPENNNSDDIYDDEQDDDDDDDDSSCENVKFSLKKTRKTKNKSNNYNLNGDDFTDENDDSDEEAEQEEDEDDNDEEPTNGHADEEDEDVHVDVEQEDDDDDDAQEVLRPNKRSTAQKKRKLVNNKTAKAAGNSRRKRVKKDPSSSELLMYGRSDGRSERLCSMPCYNLLSENEKKLIADLKIKPTQYFSIKANLIRNSRQHKNSSIASSSSASSSSSSSPLNHTNGTNYNNHHNNNYDSSSNNSSSATPSSSSSSSSSSCAANNASDSINKATQKRIFRFLCDNGWIEVD